MTWFSFHFGDLLEQQCSRCCNQRPVDTSIFDSQEACNSPVKQINSCCPVKLQNCLENIYAFSSLFLSLSPKPSSNAPTKLHVQHTNCWCWGGMYKNVHSVFWKGDWFLLCSCNNSQYYQAWTSLQVLGSVPLLVLIDAHFHLWIPEQEATLVMKDPVCVPTTQNCSQLCHTNSQKQNSLYITNRKGFVPSPVPRRLFLQVKRETCPFMLMFLLCFLHFK